GELTLVGSTVSANTAPTSGGGIHTLQTATLIESRVELNVTQRRGGGIMNEGLLIVDQGEVSRNEAQAVIDTRLTVGGGGIYNARDARITGATIEGNLTAGYGA